MSRCITVLIVLTSIAATGQQLSGILTFPEGAQRKVVLWSTRGSEHHRYDSVSTDARGRFQFQPPILGTGFYQVALNDSDRVDIILAAHEKHVEIQFGGAPLSYYVHVVKSDENQRLWEYKLASREAQAVAAAVREERKALAPTEIMRMRELDSIGYAASERARAQLTRLIEAAPKSYFAKVTSTNRKIERAMQNSRDSVVKAFDFSDPELLRSSVYANAIGAFLQSAPPTSELDIYRSVDSLLLLSGRDTGCYNYALGYLIELFSTYGPDLALQYTVDKYVAGVGSVALPRRLHEKVDELLTVSVGRTGPDVELPAFNGGTRSLSSIAGPAAYTVLFFYSSTCDHCHAQMPVLRQLYAAYHDKGLEIVGIALDDDTAAFLNTIEEEQLAWHNFSSFNGWGSPAAKAWQVKATPALYLIDNDRIIIAKPFDAQELAMRVKELMP